MTKLVKKFLVDEDGAMTIEKIALIGAVSIPLLIFLYKFGSELTKWLGDEAGQVNTNDYSAPPSM